jgi:hypothetical protein
MALEGRRRFLAGLAEARPDFHPSNELRRRIETLVEGAQSQKQLPGKLGFFQKWTEGLRSPRWALPQSVLATLLLTALLGGSWWLWKANEPRSAFAVAALKTHQSLLKGNVRLEFVSSSPKDISAWFEGRVPVHVNLPSPAGVASGSIPYELLGAGTVSVDGTNLGVVAYRVGGKPVSLLITPVSAAKLDGRKRIPMKSLVIHYDTAEGFHIVTWAVQKKGVTYALVSEDGLHPNQSCIICHAEPKDVAFMRDLLGARI